MSRRPTNNPVPHLRLVQRPEKATAEALALAERLDETARLERARGGEVERSDGRMRITSNDGLQTLFDRGNLERPEYEAGLAYRRAYEAMCRGLRSNLGPNFAAGHINGHRFAHTTAAEAVADAASKILRWEDFAMSDHRQLWALRMVAGQGCTINSLGAGGATRLKNTQLLTEALRVIAFSIGLRRVPRPVPEGTNR